MTSTQTDVNIKEQLDLMSYNIELIYYIDSVTDKKALKEIFSRHKIDVIFHASAYKHVNMPIYILPPFNPTVCRFFSDPLTIL